MDSEIIQAAREALEAGEVTAAGVPTVEALEKRLGRDISAKERDAAFQTITEGAESAEITNMEVEPMPEKKASPPEVEALVYVGPNLVGDVHIQQFTVFRGGLPAHLVDKVRDDPQLARLFVPVSGLAEARAKLRKPETAMAQDTRAVLNKYRRKEGRT